MSVEETAGRPGSAADLSRRMDRLEANHEALREDVASLTSTVSRVELNQTHAEELNKLRFASLETAIAGQTSTLGTFITRIEGLISGEVQTAQTRQGAELVADYQRWRRNVDARLPDENEVEEYREWRQGVDAFITRGNFLGRLTVIFLGGNALILIGALYTLVKA